ncbi:MAG: ABC transporter permease, partial [Proteobacteria bacterium]|nr:ABC transporter permease [Pseudomonadota bacterium]
MQAAATAPTADIALPAKGRRARSRSFWATARARLMRDPVAVVCGLILLSILAAAILAPLIAPYDPYKTSMTRRLLSIGDKRHWLGTDELGRDLLTRLIYGARMSLFMGFVPVVLATLIGGTLGVIAGYAGGALNMLIMRVMDVFYAFPSVLLAVAISGVLGAGLVNSLVSLTIVFTPPIARVAESVTTQIRNQDYVEAARATGASGWRIVFGHVLSNVTGPILIYASSMVSV